MKYAILIESKNWRFAALERVVSQDMVKCQLVLHFSVSQRIT